MKRLFVLLLVLSLGGALFAQDKVLTLDECVGIALDQNPSLIMSEFQMKMAGKDVWVSFANLLPSVGASVGYQHTVWGPSSATRIDANTGLERPASPKTVFWKSSAGARFDYDVFNARNIFGFIQSRALKESADLGFVNTKQNTIYLVKERYYNLLKAEKFLELAEETVKSSGESLKRANALFEVGKAPKSDVLTARVQAETDKLAVIKAQNDLSIARASLNHVMGNEVDNQIRVADNLAVPESSIGYADVMTSALDKHPMIRGAESDLKAANAGVNMALGQWLPSVRLWGQYGWNDKDIAKINNMLDTDFQSYLGATLSIPVFSGGGRVAGTAKAKLQKKASQAALDRTRRDIELEAKQAFFEVQQFYKQISVARNAEEAAAEGLRLNNERYSLGAGTMLDLLNAQVQSRQAKSDYIQALYGYKYAIARLERAMGQLIR